MEYIKKCNVCGNIWCYTDQDIKDNAKNSAVAAISALGSIANAIGGTRYDAYEQNKMSDRALNKVVDYDKCPNCNSKDTKIISKEEYDKIKRIEEKKKNGFATNATPESLMKRIELFIEEKDWNSASLYLEQVTDMIPDNAMVYMLGLLIEYRVGNDDELIKECSKRQETLNENKNYKYMQKFGEKNIIERIDNINNTIKKNIEEQIEKEKEEEYNSALRVAKQSFDIIELNTVFKQLNSYGNYKNSKEECQNLKEKIEKIEKENEEQKIEKDKIKKEKIKKYSKNSVIIATSLIILILIAILIIKVIIPNVKYSRASNAYNNGDYEDAVKIYSEIQEFKDAKEKLKDAEIAKNNDYIQKTLEKAEQLASENKFEDALDLIKNIDEDRKKDVENEIKYKYAKYLMNEKSEKAYEIFNSLDKYEDSKENASMSAIKTAENYESKELYKEAYEWYVKGNNEQKGLDILYSYATTNKDRKNERTYIFLKILSEKNYKDSQNIYDELYKKVVSIVMNKSADSTEPLNHTSSDGLIYIHYKVSGLHPGETYKIKGKTETKYEYRSDTQWSHVSDLEIKYEEDDVWKTTLISSGGSVAWHKYYIYDYDYEHYKEKELLATSNKLTYDENY